MNTLEQYTKLRDGENGDTIAATVPASSIPTHENAAVRLLEYVERFGKMPNQATTGFNSIDEQIKINGLCFIGGDPGTGKTSLLLNIIANRAAKNLPTIFLTFEMSAPEILQRFGAIDKATPSREICIEDIRQLNPNILQCLTMIEPGDTINEAGRFDVDKIAATVAKLRQVHGGGDVLLIVDSLNLLESDTNTDDRGAVNANVRTLSKFTKANDITTICVAQSNRDALKKGAKVYLKDFDESTDAIEPKYNFIELLYTFRESSLIEYVADSVIYLLRDEADGNGPTVTRELVNVKNRRHKINTVAKLSFNRETFKIDERAQISDNKRKSTKKTTPNGLNFK